MLPPILFCYFAGLAIHEADASLVLCTTFGDNTM